MRRETVAVKNIDSAGLNPAAYRLARRIVDRAIFTSGRTILTRDDVMGLAEVSTWRGARKLLQACAAAGIQYDSPDESTVNFTVYPLITPVTFLDQNGPDSRNDSDRIEPDPDQNGPDSRKFRDSSRARGRSGRQVGDRSAIESDTYLPTCDDDDGDFAYIQTGPGTKHEKFVGRKLLIDGDVGLDARTAKAITEQHGLETIRRAVQKYVSGKNAGTYHSPGILIEWLLKNSGRYSLPFLDDNFTETELYLRHLTVPEQKLRQAAAGDVLVAEAETERAGERLQERAAATTEPVGELPGLAGGNGTLTALRAVWRKAAAAAQAERLIPESQRSTVAGLANILTQVSQADEDGSTAVLYFADPDAAWSAQRFRSAIERQVRIEGVSDCRIIIHVLAPDRTD